MVSSKYLGWVNDVPGPMSSLFTSISISYRIGLSKTFDASNVDAEIYPVRSRCDSFTTLKSI